METARVEARKAGRTHYISETHATCGTKKRFVYSRECVHCRAVTDKKRAVEQRLARRAVRGLPAPTRDAPAFCECCGCPPSKYALALDHCHKTGMFRGWLCIRCNTGIGALGDSIEGLDRAKRYLKIVLDRQELDRHHTHRTSINTMELPKMFPVFVSVTNPEDLKKVYELLGSGSASPAAAPTEKAPTKAQKEKAAAASAAAAAAAPATAGPSAVGQNFLQAKIGPVLQELCMKDYPKAEAILKEYGVERASLVPEAKYEEFLAKLQRALNPAAAEQERLEVVDKKTSLF